MAMNPETPSKRSREDDEETLARVSEDLKRQKPSTHDNILSLLDEEEEVPVEDLSSIITTLQQELSSSSSAASAAVEGYASSSSGASSPTCSNPDNEQVEDDSLRVMRHLLEASDDELGIPNIEVNGNGFGPFDDGEEDGFNGLDGFNFGDGLWELEDEAANYYTLVQSELFM